jgi:hypothetical protein
MKKKNIPNVIKVSKFIQLNKCRNLTSKTMKMHMYNENTHHAKQKNIITTSKEKA